MDPRALIERYYQHLWNRWDYGLIPEIIAPDIEFRGSLGHVVRGHDEFRGYMDTVRAAFPDFHNEIEECVVEHEAVAAQLTYQGTHRGVLFGMAPTGRRVTYSGAAFFDCRDSRIVRGWVLGDTLTLWRQLGGIPESLLPPDSTTPSRTSPSK